jgi:adenine C2-methylase RlmN of 23S rRNA A2503 and tRNA A37
MKKTQTNQKLLLIKENNDMSQESSELYEKWNELKVLVESIEADIVKNSKGNKSAGVRARKGLRYLKTSASDIVKISLSQDKQ